MNINQYMNEGQSLRTYKNTDKHLWRKSDEPFSPSIHVTKDGGIGINVRGHVIVMPVEKWHSLGILRNAIEDVVKLL